MCARQALGRGTSNTQQLRGTVAFSTLARRNWDMCAQWTIFSVAVLMRTDITLLHVRRHRYRRHTPFTSDTKYKRRKELKQSEHPKSAGPSPWTVEIVPSAKKISNIKATLLLYVTNVVRAHPARYPTFSRHPHPSPLDATSLGLVKPPHKLRRVTTQRSRRKRRCRPEQQSNGPIGSAKGRRNQLQKPMLAGQDRDKTMRPPDPVLSISA